MGRKKLYHKRYLIGLDKYQAEQLEAMAALLSLSYSDCVSYLMDLYQLGELAPPSRL